MRSLFICLAVAALAISFATEAQAQIKNAQSVLGGTLTRAGNKGMRPLDDSQLAQLCEQGYNDAFFLYTGAPDHSVSCSRGSIHYSSQSMNSPAPILAAVYRNSSVGAKTFVHCYNGAHASGYIAALALRQFCGVNGGQAFDYWQRALNGFALPPASVNFVRNKLQTFVPNGSMQLTPAQQAQLCN